MLKCNRCDTALFEYQKDILGSLLRCYQDRIIIKNKTIPLTTNDELMCECVQIISEPKREHIKSYPDNVVIYRPTFF